MWSEILTFAGMMLRDGLLLQIIVVSAALVLILNDVSFKSGQSVLCVVLRTVCLTAVLFALYAFLGGMALYTRSGSPSKWQSLALIACTAVYATFFSGYDWRVKLLACSELIASSVTLTECGGALGRVLEVSWDMESWVVRSLCFAMIVVLALLIRRFHISRFDDMPTRGVVLTFASNVMSFSMVFIGQFIGGLAFDYPGYVAFAYFMLYVIEILSYFTFYAICSERAERVQLQAEKELVSANNELLTLSEKTLSDMRQIRHDLKNQISYMRMLFENGDADALDRFFAGMDTDLHTAISYIDCGNKNISAILNMKKAKAEASGYSFRTDIVIPDKLPFSDTDMCSILTNLLDNAIEAMEHYDFKDGYIDIRARVNGDYLYFIIMNPLPDDAESGSILRLVTNKSDKSLHGMGTKIVKRLAAKYNGLAAFDIENGKFEAKIMLDLKYESHVRQSTGGVEKNEVAYRCHLRRRKKHCHDSCRRARKDIRAIRYAHRNGNVLVRGRFRQASAGKTFRYGVPGYRYAGNGRNLFRQKAPGRERGYRYRLCIRQRGSRVRGVRRPSVRIYPEGKLFTGQHRSYSAADCLAYWREKRNVGGYTVEYFHNQH